MLTSHLSKIVFGTAAALGAWLLFAPPSTGQSDTPLAEKYTRFLEGEASYLMTDQEEEVFEILKTEEERDRFIASFWEVRDPTPDTTRNEFRDEYEERTKEANKLFRGYGREGWRTERGRTYLLLGPPHERRAYDQARDLYPMELWFYQTSDPALPDFFYLLFYRKGGAGHYRLWNMINDGPQALLATTWAPGAFRGQLDPYFQKVDTDLYQAVVAPIPGEPRSSQAFSQQEILAVIEDYPNQSMNPEFRGRYKPGSAIVDVDYMFRKMDLATLVALLPSENGPFIHYALEIPAEDGRFNQYKSTYYTVYDVEVIVETPDGKTVYQIQDKREIEVGESAWEDARMRPISLHGRIPIVPGEFVLRFLVRSRTGHIFDTFDTSIRVPEEIDVSHIVPAGFFQRREQFGSQLAFHFRDAIPVPHPTAIYRPGGSLRAFLVVTPAEVKELLQVKGEIMYGEEVLHIVNQEFPGGTPGRPALMALEIGLRSSLMPGDHRLELELSSGEKRTLPFTVELGPELVPPLVNSPAETPNASGLWNVERAKQHIALGQNLAALESLENAVERTPDLESARLQLGVLALGLGQPERALDGIVPGLMNDPFHYDMLVLAGYASEQLRELDQAVKYYERARAAEKPDERLLQALASLYEKLGELEKADAVQQ